MDNDVLKTSRFKDQSFRHPPQKKPLRNDFWLFQVLDDIILKTHNKGQFTPKQSEERCGQVQPTRDFEGFMHVNDFNQLDFSLAIFEILARNDKLKRKNSQNFVFTYGFKYVNKNNQL